MRGAASGRVVRALSLLAVLVGLLAMHGTVTDGHHGVAASSVVPWGPASAAGADAHPERAAAAGPASAVGTGACHEACPDGDAELLTLCLAVLLAGGAVLLLGLRRRVGPHPRRTGPPLRTTARAPILPRSFDAVAELCVSRT